MTDRPEELDATQLDQVSGGFGHAVGHGGSLNQSALDMIQTQSLVSQRQMALHETTDILAKLNDETQSFINNIR